MDREAAAAHRILDGSVWESFCDELKRAGQIVCQPESPQDEFTRALGYRYLTHLLRAGLESAVDCGDPQFAAFCRFADETKKIFNDNPDNDYRNCVIDGRHDYRITGHRGTVNWFSFGSKASAEDAGAMASTGELDSTQMTYESDGQFEILVSQTPKPNNWLPITRDSKMIIVRQTFGDRSREKPAEFAIQCLDPERPDNRLDVAGFEEALQSAIRFVRNMAVIPATWMDRYRVHINALPADDQDACQAAGGDPNIHYYQSYWRLEPDEALRVHFNEIPECQTWNMQISNYWMQSLDYRFFPASVNKFTAHHEEDGSAYVVLSEKDPRPRYPNWLRTTGHRQGAMLARFVGAKNPPKAIPTSVVPIAELRSTR